MTPILQTCQANWVLGKNNDQWSIADADGNELVQLPACLRDEMDVNTIRRFAMEYEQQAYLLGIETGKSAMLAANRQKLKSMNEEILLLRSMNEDLSRNLQRAFGEMEED